MEEVKITDDVDIKCGDCGNLLAKIIATKLVGNSKPQTAKYKIENCPKCGGSSFMTKEIVGTNFIWPANELYHFDSTNTDIKNGVIINHLRIIGAKK